MHALGHGRCMSYWRIVLLSLLLGIPVSAGVLEQKVAWSGTMRKVTAGEVFAKMQDWSEADDQQGTFRFQHDLSKELIAVSIDQLKLGADQGLTYRELAEKVFKRAGKTVVLDETDQGIVVTYLYSRIFTVHPQSIVLWSRVGDSAEAGLTKQLVAANIELSKYARLNLSKERQTLTITGEEKDLSAIAGFLSKK